MRLAVAFVCAICALSLVSDVASAEVARKVNKPYRGECRKLTKQMNNLTWAVQEARRRKNEHWYTASIQQVDRMWYRRERLCPGMGRNEKIVEFNKRFMELLKAAGQVALRYFTFGA